MTVNASIAAAIGDLCFLDCMKPSGISFPIQSETATRDGSGHDPQNLTLAAGPFTPQRFTIHGFAADRPPLRMEAFGVYASFLRCDSTELVLRRLSLPSPGPGA